ncbi:MAG: hypothetical protein MZV63_10795 [Marinilabiliales bacterium]|nr:hypothetical protein [Marinilabiliales bacterium]
MIPIIQSTLLFIAALTAVPESFAVGNGDMMTFSETSGFWVFNQVTNFAYTRTRLLIGDLQKKQSELEDGYMNRNYQHMIKPHQIYTRRILQKQSAILTDYSVKAGNNTVKQWKEFYNFLFTKYVDGNVKEKQSCSSGI